jgi:hypothetical protein
MALINMAVRDRMLEYESIGLLPALEEDVLFVDVVIPGAEESFVSGLDEWWPGFVSDVFL